jgi:tetratricopeptide (TPR) repeat protein
MLAPFAPLLFALLCPSSVAADDPSGSQPASTAVSATLPSPVPASVDAAPAFQIGNQAPSEILDEAIARRLHGDIRGTLDRLDYLFGLGPELPERADVLYQLGVAFEVQDSFDEAIGWYDLLLSDFPGDPLCQDGWFRRALCLEYLGHHDQALESLGHIRTEGGLDYHDRLTLDLQRGISLVRGGKAARGMKILDTTLVATKDSDAVPYLRAKGYVTRARYWMEEADRYPLDGRQRRQARHLAERAELFNRAEMDVAAAIRLKEPEWILEGLLVLGQGLLRLHDDLLAAPPPKHLTDDQEAIYRQEIEKKARVLLTKAWRYLDEGLQVASTLQYEGRPLADLRATHDAIRLDQITP